MLRIHRILATAAVALALWAGLLSRDLPSHPRILVLLVRNSKLLLTT